MNDTPEQELHSVEALTNEWPSGLLNAVEMGSKLGLSADRLLQLADAKVVPHYRIDGGAPLFKVSEVKRWAADHLLKRYEGSSIPIEIRLVTDPGPGWQQEPPVCLRALHDKLRQFMDMEGYGGIYFLCKEGQLIYVGQSTNIPARIATHRGSGKSFTHAYWIPCPRDQMDEVEGALIRHLKPPLNLMKNGSVICAPAMRNGDSVLSEMGFLRTSAST